MQHTSVGKKTQRRTPPRSTRPVRQAGLSLSPAWAIAVRSSLGQSPAKSQPSRPLLRSPTLQSSMSLSSPMTAKPMTTVAKTSAIQSKFPIAATFAAVCERGYPLYTLPSMGCTQLSHQDLTPRRGKSAQQPALAWIRERARRAPLQGASLREPLLLCTHRARCRRRPGRRWQPAPCRGARLRSVVPVYQSSKQFNAPSRQRSAVLHSS